MRAVKAVGITMFTMYLRYNIKCKTERPERYKTMNINQRIHRLEQNQAEVPERGFFSDNAELLISVVDQQGNDLYGYLETFNKPYGSTKQRLTPEQLTTLKATA